MYTPRIETVRPLVYMDDCSFTKVTLVELQSKFRHYRTDIIWYITASYQKAQGNEPVLHSGCLLVNINTLKRLKKICVLLAVPFSPHNFFTQAVFGYMAL